MTFLLTESSTSFYFSTLSLGSSTKREKKFLVVFLSPERKKVWFMIYKVFLHSVGCKFLTEGHSYRGILVMHDYSCSWMIFFSVKHEFNKITVHDPWPEGFVWPMKNLSELLTDIHDSTWLRRVPSRWLELSIESDLDIRFAVWSFDLAFHNFSFFKHSF